MDEEMVAEFFDIITAVSTEGTWVAATFVKMCAGDANCAILLSQILYWTKKHGLSFYKRHGTDHGDGWEDEIGLREHQTRRAAKKLEEWGYITTRIGHGHDHRIATHYTVDPKVFIDAIRRSSRF